MVSKKIWFSVVLTAVGITYNFTTIYKYTCECKNAYYCIFPVNIKYDKYDDE